MTTQSRYVKFPCTLEELICVCHDKYGVLSVTPYFSDHGIDEVYILVSNDSGDEEELHFKFNGLCWRSYEDWLRYQSRVNNGT